VPDDNAGKDKPTVVVYPHFASIGMHSDYVDCVRFWGDLVLSKASTGNNINVTRGEIMLWKIDGFYSGDSEPPEPPMPGYGRATRSAFGGDFQRLYTFDMTNIEPFYMRFGLFREPGYHPMLVMGNIKARFSFWDLQRFEERRTTSKKPVNVIDDKQQIKDLVEEAKSKKSSVGQASAGTRASSTTTDSDASLRVPVANVESNKRKRSLTEKVLINNTTRANSMASDSTRASSRADKQSGGMLSNQATYLVDQIPDPTKSAARVSQFTPTCTWLCRYDSSDDYRLCEHGAREASTQHEELRSTRRS
jgi:hypothetical protein